MRNFRDINVEVTLLTGPELRFSAIPEFSNAKLTYSNYFFSVCDYVTF